jgi:hypothetical protein
LPHDLESWLREQAKTNRRSFQQELIFTLLQGREQVERYAATVALLNVGQNNEP